MFAPLKITFHMDGTGVYYDPLEPPMIDGLLSWVNLPFMSNPFYLGRDDVPGKISLPLGIWRIGQYSGYHASALFPEGDSAEALLMWRKKFRQSHIEKVVSGSPNLQNGTYREYNVPLPLTLCHFLTGYCMGEKNKVRKTLKRIRFIGKKRGYGRGAVLSVSVEYSDCDYSLVKDGVAMRWLPAEHGVRMVRTMPPYWNRHDRVPCCEIGEPYVLPRRMEERRLWPQREE